MSRYQGRSLHTIRDCTTILHQVWTTDGIVEVRNMFSTTNELYIIAVFKGWEQYSHTPVFGEGMIIHDKFRWICQPKNQYPNIENISTIQDELGLTIQQFYFKGL